MNLPRAGVDSACTDGQRGQASEPNAEKPRAPTLPWTELAAAIRLLDFGSDALLCLDEGEHVVICNRGAEQMFGLERRSIEGLAWRLLLAEGSRGILRDALRRIDAVDQPSSLPLRNGALLGRRWDGSQFPLEGSLSRLRLGPLRGYTLLLRDISARVEHETRLRYLAMHDSLTGLPNRALLMDRLQNAIRQHRRGKKAFALLFVDLDDFKAINDRFGHGVGDAALRACAARLRQALRDSDTAARIGGDEFAVILEDVDGLDDVQQAIERIDRSLREQPVIHERATVWLGASIGFTLYPLGGAEPEELLTRADEAMYAIKRGRGQQRR